MSSIFIVGAKRTPFGAFGGKLKNLSATDLAVHASQAAMNGMIDPSLVDAVFVGNVIQSSKDAAYLARHVGLRCQIPIPVPALTINRLCGSGFETVLQAQAAIRTDQASVVLAAGTENMSNAPLSVEGNKARWGVALGAGLPLHDALWDGLTDALYQTPMGVTAENLAKKHQISRLECDEYAIRSQTLWGKAHKEGIFAAEMAPIEIITHKKKSVILVDQDEHPRPETTLEKISALSPVFAKDGVVTAANASGICDGAGALLVASEQAVKQHNLQPLARVVATAVTGCEPTEMGIGPVSAINKALKIAGLKLSDMDRIEINEAFASQFLACAKELDLDMNKTNLHGGAISLGHPLGASGSRILAHLTHEFKAKPNHKYHVGAACIGGGQGIAVILESV